VTAPGLVFVDDAVARDFAPFALTRPCCELRAGAVLIRHRWEFALGLPSLGFVGAPHLADFDEPWGVGAADGELPAGSIVVNSRCAVALESARREADVWRCGRRVAAVRLARAVPAARLAGADTIDDLVAAGAREAEVDGWWLDRVWDLVRHLSSMLGPDILALASSFDGEARPEAARVGGHPVFVERGAAIEPWAVFDTSSGPVLVRRDATVQAFTRVVGPCYIGEGTLVAGGRVAGSAIGEQCRVHGELSASILLGHTNKSHEGFIGHSVLGRWVNLGASTVNSNLKNTYGTVTLWTPGGMADTGLQFLGSFIGDHAKTGIGTRLTTGCLIGAGANVIGTAVSPKVIPPFAWGMNAAEPWELERFLLTAERMMQRRKVTMTDRARRQLSAAWRQQWGTAG
jgi:UDP-N-acetylglucosamine diphosphorylase/glucosamine-1-phosphate N-acetyltransferase